MRIFVTGATGFIGSAIVQELLGAGHQVLGLVRSDASAQALAATGAEVHRGTLEDLDSLRSGAAASDGVIHTAFIHDFSNIAASGEIDRDAVEAMGAVLAESNRPLVIASGLALVTPGRIASEEDSADPNAIASHRSRTETMTLAMASKGVRASVVRLPPTVHGDGDHGFVPRLIAIAREKGASAYVGDGANRWPAVHRLDAARLFRLAMEKGAPGSTFHSVGDEGVPARDIAGVIGRHLDLPVVSKSREEIADHFGWIGNFFAIDCPATAILTRERLGWSPTHVGLIDDLAHGTYFDN